MVRYLSFCKRAGVDPCDVEGVVKWFVEQPCVWAPSTVRQYRAAISVAIEAEETGCLDVQSLLMRVGQGPAPRKSGPRRTSARKRRSIPQHQFNRLIRRLMDGDHPDDRLAARLLSHNVILFMRPGEWLWANLEGTVLTIRNGKSTNGRALGKHRQLDLQDYGQAGVSDLSDLLAVLKSRAQDAVDFRKLWAKLASRIARACESIHIKRVAPYSTRHVGMSTAKLWMSPAQVAAAAGHKTTATASMHYARSHTGWRSKRRRVYPMPEAVAQVIQPLKASRAENMAYWKERRRDAEGEPPAFKP
ncbi:hypothetical protein IVA96_07540 [Bradyrhizobium sp. 159]|uniref:hypothetical protein n=1 Tax=Bradyrhizobium sp. 159 TaxID=2782632 RepID=UPI001FFB57F7|nr:hypothetical protein [Bradyrhizobium sp. 159]MCK1616508.1 hypothetical protein [Bradyrhizobium sp. 159]